MGDIGGSWLNLAVHLGDQGLLLWGGTWYGRRGTLTKPGNAREGPPSVGTEQGQIQRELTLQASLRPGVCRRRTSNGVPWAKLNEPWINAREDRMRKGNGASAAQCATRPSNHLRTWLVRADMATFKRVALPRLDMLNRRTLGQCTAPEVGNLMQDLDVDLGPTGLSLLRAPPLHVFTEALAGLQKGDSARRMDLGALGRLGGASRRSWQPIAALPQRCFPVFSPGVSP